ncbi:MAG: threonine aldolase [Phycisphaeraceae bacterium]|nr:MAG: threonine aldolase [Phycisphaeraceae bacterium]
MRTFRSDNNAGLCPEALRAMIDANDGSHQVGYGDDVFTARAVAAFHDLFGHEAAVFFVATGTAANTLTVTALTEPWQRVLCHAHSHLSDDESTAPERFSHCRMTVIRTESSKLTVEDVQEYGGMTRGDVHQPAPGVLSISNPTEFGTVYTPDETAAICEAAHRMGYRVHVDGARFANAVAHLGCDPRELTVSAGVDALSFGGTKNGLAFGEAVLFFPQGDRSLFTRAVGTFPFHRKGTGHLLSKHRFVAAPFEAVLRSGAWLHHAAHANRMALMLSEALRDTGVSVRFPTQANGVFASLAPTVESALRARGHQFYTFGEPSWNMARFMCSHDTHEDDVRGLAMDAAKAIGGAAASAR